MEKLFLLTILCFLAVYMVEVKSQNEPIDDIQQQLDVLKRQMSLLENENKEIKAKLHSMETKSFRNKEDKSRDTSIAFNAFLGSDQEVHSGATILFDNVSLNSGTYYNPQLGEFTCPVTGIYFFAFNLHARNDDDWTAQIQVARLDGTTDGLSASCWNGAHSFSSGTAATTLCNANEKVFVRNTWPSVRWARSKWDDSHQDGVFQSSFTGFLVNQEF